MELENLQNKIIELTEKSTQLENDYNSIRLQKEELEELIRQQNEEYTKKINDLQEHNQKLFLRITHQKQEKIKSNEEFNSKLLGDYAKNLSDRELEILRELEEEL